MPRRAHFEDAFFAVLERKGDVTQAAELAGVHRNAAYYRRKDPNFRQRWERSLAIYRASVRDRALRDLRRTDLRDF